MIEYLTNLAKFYKEPVNTRQAIIDAFEIIATQEERVTQKLIIFLCSKSKVTILGSASYDRSVRVPTSMCNELLNEFLVSFVVRDVDSEELGKSLGTMKIGTRTGHGYVKRMMDHIGLLEGPRVNEWYTNEINMKLLFHLLRHY